MVNPGTISLRRRHLMIAGLAGAAAPLLAFAGRAGACGAGGKLIVSGRILRPDRKPLAGATVEVWHAGAEGGGIRVATDADGRFMFVTAVLPRQVCYRVSHEGHETPVRQLSLAQPQRDEKGAWRATFGLTLA